ncbi:hypothetical protein C8Q73DRAFT_673304 [Cubamyces lactineus]|nr:hypothetical protein C8Q73DRAFT_673304 [Cubamyces lactineus]
MIHALDHPVLNRSYDRRRHRITTKMNGVCQYDIRTFCPRVTCSPRMVHWENDTAIASLKSGCLQDVTHGGLRCTGEGGSYSSSESKCARLSRA